jgi:hypothetical protein
MAFQFLEAVGLCLPPGIAYILRKKRLLGVLNGKSKQ